MGETVSREEKVELTLMVDNYERPVPQFRATGESEKARLDTVGDWSDSSSRFAFLEPAYQPKNDLYGRLAVARGERAEAVLHLSPTDRKSTLDFLPEELRKRAGELGGRVSDYAPWVIAGVLAIVVLKVAR